MPDAAVSAPCKRAIWMPTSIPFRSLKTLGCKARRTYTRSRPLEEQSMSATVRGSANPLSNLDQWEDFLEGRYKEGKSESDFRQYDAEANPGVAEFYCTNHE